MTNKETPNAIGVILDGNRRWAKEQGLPPFEGHREGSERVKDLVRWAREFGVGTVYIYAFSTENWNRAEEEVSYLMKLMAKFFAEGIVDDIEKEDGRVVFLGDRTRIPPELVSEMERTEERTRNGKAGTLAVCLSYGGRAEIIAAANKLIREGKEIQTEEEFSSALWSAGLPDPDLIIRTSGEQRLSGFLTWQSVYSELFFTATKWPAFTKEEFVSILEEYATRERRKGK
ncbi:MAG: polyprenyl diphosphate synthase [Patescibacteria group bacterium]